jgi:hypothetical protein
MPLSGKKCVRSTLHTACFLFGGNVHVGPDLIGYHAHHDRLCGADKNDAMTGLSIVGRLIDSIWILFLGSSA